MTKVAHAFISGRVQGVGFRFFTLDQAKALGVSGWVRNTFDGRVEVWVEGEPAAVDAMLAWLRQGPSMAHVDGVDLRPAEVSGFSTFEVRSSSH